MADLINWAGLDDKARVEETPIDERWEPHTVYQMLQATAASHGDRPALSFQITATGKDDKAETLTWSELARDVTRTANMLRSFGIGPDDVVAYLLPNCNETVMALIGGLTAGIVLPVNPLLDTEHIAGILRESGAKVLITLAPFPQSDVAEKAHGLVGEVPSLEVILEVDLKHYLPAAKGWLVGLVRKRTKATHNVRILDFHTELAKHDGKALTFQEDDHDRIAAYFHTGGTTGMPKIAKHRQKGMTYQGRIPALHMITHEDVLICPLPLFHVFAAYPILMTCVASGAHMVLPTPQGYRGKGVVRHFWTLVERWKVTLLIMVPTAASALIQKTIEEDVSTLRWAICGSAPLPASLFNRFEEATGVRILEGYGMTEATCLISINPPHGERKVGSVGYPIPYCEVKILDCDDDGRIVAEKGKGEVGEICVRNPGVFPGYSDERRNVGLFAGDDGWLRTGDLGKIDDDGYLWIVGRAKDLIIRGGHNIDPALIEEALLQHPAVAFAGAVGQPDVKAGELPCAYVELQGGAKATSEELIAFAAEQVPEQAAVPKHVEILPELPKTAVGKIFKPALRKLAISRVYGEALERAGVDASIEVVDDKAKGLTAEVKPAAGADRDAVPEALDGFSRPWRFA